VWDTEKILVLFFVFGGGFWVLRPLAYALAKRIGGEGAARTDARGLAELREELLGELQQVRREVGELAERVDFTERLLAQQRDGERLAPPRS